MPSPAGVPVLRVGMQAPGRLIRLTFYAPPGIDFTAVAKSLAVTCRVRTTGESFALSPWSPVNVAADQMQMEYAPDGTEFNRPGLPGQLKFSGVLTLASVPYDVQSFYAPVIAM